MKIELTEAEVLYLTQRLPLAIRQYEDRVIYGSLETSTVNLHKLAIAKNLLEKLEKGEG